MEARAMSKGHESRRQQLKREAKKRKRRQRGKLSSDLMLQSPHHLFDEVKLLVEQGDDDAAHSALEALETRFGHRPEILQSLCSFHAEQGDYPAAQRVCERLLKREPKRADYLLMYAGICIENQWMALACQSFERFLSRWPDHELAAEARETVRTLRAGIEQTMYAPIPLNDSVLEMLADNERVQIALRRGDHDEAIRIGESVLQHHSDAVPVLNNLTNVYALAGRFDKALAAAEQALKLDASKLHPLANLVRLHVLMGSLDRARELARQLLELPSTRPDAAVKKAEALSFLGDDEAVWQIFQQRKGSEELVFPQDRALLRHLAAVTAARRGDHSMARQLWREALQLDPTLDLAAGNLADLDAQVSQRNGPWTYAVQYWISQRLINELPVRPAKQACDIQMSAPEIVLKQAALALLDRGDDLGRNFAIRLARFTKDDELLEAVKQFGLSDRGTDLRRRDALMAAIESGVASEGEHRLWVEGQWQPVRLQMYELHDEPDQHLKGKVLKLYTRAMEATYENDLETAEELYLQAMKSTPNEPTILNNLASIYRGQGREQEARQILHRVTTEFPDYFFGRIAHVFSLIKDRKLDEARQMLETQQHRRRFHFSEFSAWCTANVELCLAEGNRNAARGWLQMWESVYPDDHLLPDYRKRVSGGLLGRLLPW
jgi:tetratricopeptide (TPR) repeat protein